MDGEEVLENRGFLLSVFISAVVFSQVTPMVSNLVVTPRLYDASINALGRYALPFDAYDYISENERDVVIALGSSKMREAFDGNLYSETISSDYDFFNVAYGGEYPYVRVIEIEAIVSLRPKLVLLEIGPNTFSELSTPISEGIQIRMAQLMALGERYDLSHLQHVLEKEDYELLPNSRLERMEILAGYFSEAAEKSISFQFDLEDPRYPCVDHPESVRCVPTPNNASFDKYLRYPTQFTNHIQEIREGIRTVTIEEFYGPNLDKYINRSYHNPEGVHNKNQMAYEFMIKRLTEEGINVILVGLPYNPVLIERLAPAQWDYYNNSVSEYSQNDAITVVDLIWNTDWTEEEFNDYSHLSREGEIKLSEILSQEISPLLDLDG